MARKFKVQNSNNYIQGVKVNLKNGRHILIGSQNHNALANTIDNFIGS